MVELKKYFSNSIFTAAFIVVLFIYSPYLNINLERKTYCLFQLSSVTFVKGKLLSSPVKQNNGKYYSSDFQLLEVGQKNNFFSSADGTIKVFIPSSFVEAFFPGKLYSSSFSTTNCIYETGGLYSFQGKCTKNGFYINNCVSFQWENSFWGKIDRIRALLRLQFKRLMYNWGNAGGFLLALLSGAREYTSEEISNAFRLSGLSHILALSGMHLSMFSGIAMFIGKKSKRRSLMFIIRIIALILFVWFAGFSPSLLRAFICASLVLFSSMVDVKNPDMLLILCTSFLLQSMISPQDLQNTGFILSYGALCGIILFNKMFQKIYIRFFSKYISCSLSSSTSAQIITAPISLKKFGCFSPVGIVATCFISPLVTLFIYSGLVLIILSLIFPFVSNLSGIFMNFLYTIIKYLVLVFSKVPVWSIN